MKQLKITMINRLGVVEIAELTASLHTWMSDIITHLTSPESQFPAVLKTHDGKCMVRIEPTTERLQNQITAYQRLSPGQQDTVQARLQKLANAVEPRNPVVENEGPGAPIRMTYEGDPGEHQAFVVARDLLAALAEEPRL